jgi:hypothetical protein
MAPRPRGCSEAAKPFQGSFSDSRIQDLAVWPKVNLRGMLTNLNHIGLRLICKRNSEWLWRPHENGRQTEVFLYLLHYQLWVLLESRDMRHRPRTDQDRTFASALIVQ